MKNGFKTMGYSGSISVGIMCLLLGISGCYSLKNPPRKLFFYTLEYPSPTFEKLSPLPASIRVDSFQTSPDYSGRQIIYREADFSRQAYIYHKWHSSPGSLLSYLFMRDLRRSRLFSAVTSSGQALATGYVLSGMVDQFLEEDTAKGRFAYLAVTLTLSDTGGRRAPSMVLQKHYDIRQPIEGQTASAIVRAMSQAALLFSKRAIGDIYAALAKADKREDL